MFCSCLELVDYGSPLEEKQLQRGGPQKPEIRMIHRFYP